MNTKHRYNDTQLDPKARNGTPKIMGCTRLTHGNAPIIQINGTAVKKFVMP